MDILRKTLFLKIIFTIPAIFILTCANSYAQEKRKPIEVNGDQVEFMMEGNKIIADGNVVVKSGKITLECDRLEFYRDSKMAYAQGNVILTSGQGKLLGDEMTYNFGDMTGEFVGAKVISAPFYGAGDVIKKVGENHMRAEEGHITTCDLEKPHFRMVSRKIDIYPGDKAVAKGVRLYVGKIPIFYIPQYTKDLRDRRQKIILTPGYDKEWGAFLLAKYRYFFDEGFKGTLHVDYREKKDLAWGIDLDYKTNHVGEGIIRTYYMNERNITSDHFWEERPSPTIEKERFKVEWRHKWEVDDRTNAILQYYKISDSAFLQDYFENEYEVDPNPETYFLLTRLMKFGTLSFRTDARVNRYLSAVERLPEIQYTLSNQKIGETGIYFQNRSTFSNLTNKDASPSEVRRNTMRVDSDGEFSYPFKLGFIELSPSVGGRATYYSKTSDPSQYDVVRTLFKTGVSLSTKFYKLFDISGDYWGIELNRLRHIITPSISYQYTTDPSIHNNTLDQYDGIDSITQAHQIDFSLENKLQTKRDGESVDLLRGIVSTNFLLKEQVGVGGFNTISTDWEFRPAKWLEFYADTSFDATRDKLTSANFDIYLKDEDKWTFDFGKRYNIDSDDQITAQFTYKINPKWKFRGYYRFDIDAGLTKLQEYGFTRDLHCWEMEVNFNETRGHGDEIWIIFRLKAFPEIGFDFGTSFNKRKKGSQSSIGD